MHDENWSSALSIQRINVYRTMTTATMNNNLLSIQPYFPATIEESIDTIEFLNASKGLVRFIEQLGFAFEPVKNDFYGNIEKLNRKYRENTVGHRCLKQMILIEKNQGENFATESLLWLRRGLSFMSTLLQIFLEKERDETNKEDLDEVVSLAYERTLKPHHGLVTRILFKALCTRCPKRSQLLEILGCPENGCRSTFHSMLDAYLSNLVSNLEMLVNFYRSHNIQPYH